MIYRINKDKLKPHIILKFGSIARFNGSLGISKMRWSQITRTNYRRVDVPAITKIRNILGLAPEQFVDMLDIGE